MLLLNKINIRANSFLLFSLLSALAFLLRYSIAFQDISYLDRLFIPDDTYYILNISRSIAAGLGPTTDGIHLTSGFQPLFCFLEVPFFWLGFNNDNALVAAIYLSAFWGGLSTFVLGYLLKLINGISAAVIGSFLWIFCPIILKNDLNGMETSLAGFLSLLVLLIVILIDKKSTVPGLFCLGLVCGLALLARIDTCFLLLVIGVFALVRWGFYRTLLFVSVAFLVVIPWWFYAFKTFGTIVPESGSAIKEFITFTHKTQQFFSVASLYALIEWFPLFREAFYTAFLGILLTFYFVGRGAYRAGIYGYIVVLPLFLGLAFYTFYFPAYWYLTRYFYFIYAVILICISLVIAAENRPKVRLVYFGFLALVLGAYLIALIPFYAKPENTSIPVLNSLKGYREIVLAINKHLNPGDVVGAFQSGALGYYAPQSVRVINLDGVVNGEAAKALKAVSMKSYVDSEQMNRFADWEYNAYFFQLVYGGIFPAGCFNTLYRAKKQGSQNFVLRNYRLKC
ncbi:MAG: hypothetical protein H0T84_06330 [Tatlockia sp.]|nr:hypothetical protein [Tatlockia sp.]